MLPVVSIWECLSKIKNKNKQPNILMKQTKQNTRRGNEILPQGTCNLNLELICPVVKQGGDAGSGNEMGEDRDTPFLYRCADRPPFLSILVICSTRRDHTGLCNNAGAFSPDSQNHLTGRGRPELPWGGSWDEQFAEEGR